MTNVERQKSAPESLKKHIVKIARRWKKDPNCELSDAPISNVKFKMAFEQVTPKLLTLINEVEFYEFVCALRTQAMHTMTNVTPPLEGRDQVASLNLFVIPFHGTKADLTTLLENDNAFQILTDSFKEFGLAHPQSQVRLLRGFLPIEVMAQSSAYDIQMMTWTIALPLVTGAHDDALRGVTGDDILNAIGGRRKIDDLANDDMVDVGLIGVRAFTHDRDQDAPQDYFSNMLSPSQIACLEQQIEDETEDGGYDSFNDEMLTRWFSMARVVTSKNSKIEAPRHWDETIEVLNETSLKHAIAILKHAHDIDQEQAADEIAVFYDENAVGIELVFGNKTIGPLKLARCMVPPSGVMEHVLNEMTEKISVVRREHMEKRAIMRFH